MPNSALADTIWADESLRAATRDIARKTAAADIPVLSGGEEPLDLDWFHLLRCAAILVSTTDEKYYDIGLRIMHGCLTLSQSEKERALSAALLAKIASNPSIELAKRRSLIPPDVLSRLPLDLALDVAAKQISSTINIGSNTEFIGNDFQTTLWRALARSDWVSASAPTSVGKSFILEKWIENAINTQASSSTFYIVPTRALIGQVETDLRIMLRKRADDINITSLPLAFSETAAHNIYIYTQERFHLYLLKPTSSGDADLIVIDEAQQIGADRRGILLQQVLELASRRYPSAKFLFASPSTENPQTLLSFAPEGKRTEAVAGTKPTVNQNLFWVEQVPRSPTQWEVNLLQESVALRAGRLSLANRPTTTQKLPFIAQAIAGGTAGNVVYVNRASDAEKVAEILCQFIPKELGDEELNALSEFCEKAVHPKFVLRRFVRKGVAFHYGNMPQLIRTEIERLFSSGKIQFLVCTSTLVEGVNLSCRNIFMRNPKRGMKNLMSPDDFWNLAGRAGRWGREFQGNIFCIDPTKANEWAGGSAPQSKRRHTIRIATQRIVSQYEQFLAYIKEGAAQLAPPDRFLEYLFSYLVFRHTVFGDLAASLASSGLSHSQIDEVVSAVSEAVEAIGIPIEIVHRNPGINPYGIKALYDYFQTKEPSEYDALVPADPLSDAPVSGASAESNPDDPTRDAAVENFIRIFTRISKHLQGSLGIGNTSVGNAILVVHWMRGYPLTRIIEGQIRYWARKESRKSTSSIIRETMERVEKVARFETPKYLHCYIDVLLYFFKTKGHTAHSAAIEDFWLYLEFGVAKRTQLSLMSLGLSRSSVTALSDYITEDALSERACLDWLESNSWPEFGLPRLVQLEIDTILQRHGRSSAMAGATGDGDV